MLTSNHAKHGGNHAAPPSLEGTGGAAPNPPYLTQPPCAHPQPSDAPPAATLTVMGRRGGDVEFDPTTRRWVPVVRPVLTVLPGPRPVSKRAHPAGGGKAGA
jgi:hypothetical protein